MEIPHVPENINEVTYFGREQSPVTFVSVGDCRNFMRGIVDEEWVWPELQKRQWGGHWHRAVLNIALLDVSNDQYVNFMPFILRVIYDDPKDMLSPQTRASIAFSRIEDAREGDDDQLSAADIINEQGYSTQGELPGSILKSFEGQRRDYLEDRYFYPRHGLTGERFTEPKFSSEPNFEDS